MKWQPIKAVAFDAYGTLIEIGEKRRPFAKLAALSGQGAIASPLTERIGLEQFYAAVGQHSDAPSLKSLQRDLAVELASTHAYPEAAFVLGQLRDRGIRTAVASNLAMPYADQRIRADSNRDNIQTIVTLADLPPLGVPSALPSSR